jgi:hypothetical protein
MKRPDELFHALNDGRSGGARPAARPAGPIPEAPAPVVAPPALAPKPPAPPRSGTAPAIRVASSTAPFVRGSTFASLLPGGAPPTPIVSPAPPRPGTALADDDAPILVIEDFPPGAAILPDGPKPLFARTLVLRFDTAAVSAFVLAIAIGTAFMLGRASVRTPAAAPLAPPTAAIAAPLVEPPPPAPPASPLADARDPAPSDAPAAAPELPGAGPAAAAPAQRRDLFYITVLQQGTKEGTEDVKKILESKGLAVALEKVGDRFNVHVGSYADRRAPEVERDLAAVRAIEYRGKKAFKDAFVEPMKRSQ